MELKEGLYYNSELNQVVVVEKIIFLKPGYLVLFELPYGKSEALFKSIRVKKTKHIVYLGEA